MSFERVLHHRAMRFCALICLTLLLTAFFCAPIHKHNTGQDASCLFCHASARAEGQLPADAPGPPVLSLPFVPDSYASREASSDVALRVRIPRAPPIQLLSL